MLPTFLWESMKYKGFYNFSRMHFFIALRHDRLFIITNESHNQDHDLVESTAYRELTVIGTVCRYACFQSGLFVSRRKEARR